MKWFKTGLNGTKCFDKWVQNVFWTTKNSSSTSQKRMQQEPVTSCPAACFGCIAISWIGFSLKWFGNKPFIECWMGFKLVWTSSNIPKMCILGVYPSNPKYTFAISGARATLNMIYKVQMQILHRKYLTDSILWKIFSVWLHVFTVMFAVFIL